jgi:hypothetical protein
MGRRTKVILKDFTHQVRREEIKRSKKDKNI